MSNRHHVTPFIDPTWQKFDECDIRWIYFEDEIIGSESYYAYGLL